VRFPSRNENVSCSFLRINESFELLFLKGGLLISILNSESLNQFHRDGYVIAPSFFDKTEVRALQKEVHRFTTSGIFKNVSTDGDGETPSSENVNLQLIPLHDKSMLIRSLPFENKVVNAISYLIGVPAALHLDQMFLKPAKYGVGTSWHQDNAYFKIANPLGGTAMWVAIHDATIANGTICVIPGSHEEEYEHFRDPNSNHHIRCNVPEEKSTPIELKAGGVVFFCYGTAHCTMANNTNQDRAGMAFHFLNSNFIVKDQITEQRPVISGPKNSNGEQEYGSSQEGRWREEIATILSR